MARLRFLILFFFVRCSINVWAQCECTNCPINLPDVLNTPFVGSLSVCGATNNILGVNNSLQQVCVNISHTWIGDLDVSLVAPDGTTVVLFADGNNQFNGGNGTSPFGNSSDDMDVCFVLPSASAVGNFGVANAGTGDICSPGQSANVACNGTTPCYTGNWYPWNQNCGGQGLNAFNNGTGTVNGTWTIVIRDNAGGNSGTLNNFTLVFANNAGITCVSTSGASAGPNQTVCASNAAFNLTGATPSGGTWSGTGITNATAGTFNPSVAGPGVHTLTYTVGCTNVTKTVTVVDPTLTASASATVGGNTSTGQTVSVCPGGCASLNASGTASTTTYTATLSQTATPNLPINNSPATNLTHTSTINITGLNPGATINSVCFNINHTYAADLDIFLICPGGTRLELTTDNGGNGDNFVNTCFSPNATVPITSVTAANAPFTGTYLPEGNFSTLNSCITDGNWSLEVTDDFPSLDNGTFLNWTISFNNPTPNSLTYSWSPSSGLSTTSGASPNACPSASTTYTVTATDLTGCTKIATTTVNVNPTPVVTGLTNQTICTGDVFAGLTFNSNPAGATFSWTNSNPSIGLAASGTGDIPSFTATNTSTGPINSTITVVPSLNGCVGTPSSFSITVNPIPNANVTNNPTICQGQSVTLTGTGVGITNYSWSTGQTGANISVSPATTTTYTLVATSATTCRKTMTTTVTVNSLPTLTFSGNTSICQGASTSITVSGANTYSWTSGLGTNSTISVSPGNTTTYSVFGTSAENCTSSSTVTVFVNENPTITVSGANSLCAGDSVTLTASGASSYSWSNGTLNSSITVSPVSNSVYTVWGTDGNGCTAFQTKDLTINPQPNLTISGPNSVCFGSTFNLSASGGSSYSWSTGQTGANLSPTASATTTYVLIGTSAAGCVDSVTKTVVVNLLPSVSITDPAPICVGQITNLVANGAFSYSWSTGSTAGFILVAPTSTTQYTVWGTDQNGCTNSAIGSVQVNPLPNISISGNQTICTGGSTTLTGVGAQTYSWSNSTVADSIIVSPTTNASYTVWGTDTNGCSETASVTVSVVNAPPLTVTNNTGIICLGDQANLEVSGGTTYSWSSGQIGSSVWVNPASTTVYTVYSQSNLGCQQQATVQVIVRNLPIVSINGSTAICSGSNATLTANGAVTYSWTNGQSGSSITVSPTTTTIYTVTGTDAFGCSNTATFIVGVNPLPTISVAGEADICSGNSTTITASGLQTYTWSNGSNSASITVSPISSTSYTVSGSDNNGCVNSETFAVTVHNPPVLVLSPNVYTCVGGSSVLTASGALSYSWFPAAGLSSTTDSSVIASPTTTTVYTVVGTDQFGCSNSGTITFTIQSTLNMTHSPPTSVCAGQSVALFANGATTYSWVPNNGTLNVTNQGNVISTPSTNITYTVYGTAGSCSDVVYIPVTVNPLPNASDYTGGNKVVCSGEQTILGVPAVVGMDYSWYPSSGLNNSLIAQPVFNGQYSESYMLFITDVNGCSGSASINVTVNPKPLAEFFTTDICLGNIAVFVNQTTGGAVNYTWNFGDGSSDYFGDTPLHNYSNCGYFPVTLIASTTSGCADTVTRNIGIVCPPVALFTVSDTTICSGETVYFTNQSFDPLGATLQFFWDFDINSNEGTSFVQNPSHQYNTPYPQPAIVQLIVTNATGCSDTAFVNIGISDSPIADFTVEPVCLNQPTVFVNTTQVNGGATPDFYWYFGNAAGTSSTLANPIITYASAQSYQVTLISMLGNGCADTVTKSAVVYPLPQPNFDVMNSCVGQPVVFTNTTVNTGGLTFSWDFTNDGINDAYSLNAQYTPPVDGSFQTALTATNLQTGCSERVVRSAMAYKAPLVDFIQDKTEGCERLCVGLTDASQPQENGAQLTQWTWTFNNAQPAYTPTISRCLDAGTYTTKLKVVDSNGCADSVIKVNNIISYSLPSADFGYSPENPTELSSNVSFYDISEGNVTQWSWNFGVEGDSLNLSEIRNPSYNYLDTGNYCITLKVQTAKGCTDTITRCLRVSPEFAVYIPSGFTPNANGVNEVFKVEGRGIDLNRGFTMRIFNRFGNLIFETSDIFQGWDGKHMNKYVAADTYVYRIDLFDMYGREKQYNGVVNVIR